MFDKKETGKISEEELTKILTNKRGEPLDEDEIKAMYKVIFFLFNAGEYTGPVSSSNFKKKKAADFFFCSFTNKNYPELLYSLNVNSLGLSRVDFSLLLLLLLRTNQSS